MAKPRRTAEPSSGSDLTLVLRAASFAADRHRRQRRKDLHATPYINHPLDLASILAVEGGVIDAEVIAAALLHDTLEDTQTTAGELRDTFGDRVASMVEEVTDDPDLDHDDRKQCQIDQAPRLTQGAKLVRLADKIANLRDIAEHPPHAWGLQRKRDYFDWAARVVDRLRGANAGLEQAFDEVLRRRP